MPLSLIRTDIEDVWIIESPVFRDERGYFMELYQEQAWTALGLQETFVQDNLSSSPQGTLRGMHYQLEPHGIGKLVRAISGAVFDVAVDLRDDSPTFGKWVGTTLSAQNGRAMWVPRGFAHGFLALEPDTLVFYKCTGYWNKESERSLVWNDPTVAIQWPAPPTLINPRDAGAPTLDKADRNFPFTPTK